DRFTALGFEPKTQTYAIMGKPYQNLEVEIPGKAKAHEIVLIGAHYDSVPGSPGADDNASGIGSLLEIARLIQGKNFARTVRFAAFVNEEPPFFMTRDQGSRVYARRAKAQNDNITAMLCLESVAYYTDAKRSQRYPFPVNFFYPKTGNFIAFVGNIPSRGLVRACVAGFRKSASFPCEGAALPGLLPGISWSDHRSFWAEGYRAIMITDTVPYRNPHYHTSGDRPETLDFGRAARVTAGLIPVVDELAEASGDTAKQG
ncbi:MAG: M28 family peptidase, partial [Thermodesulfobacteriota bacterium]|nr:M28 family peptidase [Thermodesulfobacteriota bacterium]